MGDMENNVNGKKNLDELTVEEMAAKTTKTAKSKLKDGKAGFFTLLKAEFKKIIWPSRKSLFRQTVAVLFSSVAVGIIIAVVDIVIRLGLELIVK